MELSFSHVDNGTYNLQREGESVQPALQLKDLGDGRFGLKGRELGKNFFSAD